MLQTLRETLMLSSKDSLARAFLRLGWAGLGIQIVIGSIPVLVAIYALIFGRNTGVGTRFGSLPIECLTIAALIVTVFTTNGPIDIPALASRLPILHGGHRNLRFGE